MNRNSRDEPRRVYAYRGKMPVWLLLLLVPFGALFLLSLTAAIAIGGFAALVFPLFWRGARHVSVKHPREDGEKYIELDPSDYRRVDGPEEDGRQ